MQIKPPIYFTAPYLFPSAFHHFLAFLPASLDNPKHTSKILLGSWILLSWPTLSKYFLVCPSGHWFFSDTVCTVYPPFIPWGDCLPTMPIVSLTCPPHPLYLSLTFHSPCTPLSRQYDFHFIFTCLPFSVSFYFIGSRDFLVTRHHMTWSHDGHMILSHDNHMTIPFSYIMTRYDSFTNSSHLSHSQVFHLWLPWELL